MLSPVPSLQSGHRPITSWFDEFIEWSADNHPSRVEPLEGHAGVKVPKADDFYTLLGDFLDAPIIGSAYARMLALSKPLDDCLAATRFTCTIKASLILVEEEYSDVTTEEMENVRRRRAIVDASFLPVFIYDGNDMSTELDMLMVPETTQNLLLAVASVIAVGTVLLVHPQITLLVAITIIAIDLELIGLMTALDVSVSPISLIFLIMSVGLSFDYVAHLAHACT